MIDKEAGKRLKMVRKDVLNISSGYELAEKMGMSQGSIASYEVGRLEMGVDFLSKLHKMFGILPTYIVSGTGEIRDMPGKKSATITDIANMKSDIVALKAMVDYLKKQINK